MKWPKPYGGYENKLSPFGSKTLRGQCKPPEMYQHQKLCSPNNFLLAFAIQNSKTYFTSTNSENANQTTPWLYPRNKRRSCVESIMFGHWMMNHRCPLSMGQSSHSTHKKRHQSPFRRILQCNRQFNKLLTFNMGMLNDTAATKNANHKIKQDLRRASNQMIQQLCSGRHWEWVAIEWRHPEVFCAEIRHDVLT